MRINGKEIFEKDGLMFNLSRMASLEYQDKYLVHATAKYYEDPSEMADILYTECENALLERFKFCFLPYERDALRELLELIDRYFKDQSLLEGVCEYLIYHNKSWVEVRELALKTLYTFGYDLEDFDYD